MARWSFLLFVEATFLFSCQEPEPDKLFTLLSSRKTNITFKNVIKETEVFNVLKYGYFYNGGGVAVGDINNDGLPDIYFTGNMVASHLYLNKGNWEFEEIAEQAGVAAAGLWNTGVTMADINGDGFLDIYVCRSAAANELRRKNLLFINNGDLTFTEHANTFGLDDSGYSTQAAFFDYDRDGDLDMYLLNHSVQEFAGFSNLTQSLKEKQNRDYGDKLFRNEEVLFVDVTRQAGIKTNVLGFGLGLGISDVNNDGWQDIYVSNDYNEEDYLYINNQDGTFSDRLSEQMGHVSLFSMGSDIADFNNDGYPDIMTLDMLPEGSYRQKLVFGPDNYDKYQRLISSGFHHQSMRNMLQLNRQGLGFSEIGQMAGVSNTDWSWASLFADFDNDGYKDLFITNGYQRDYTNMDFMNFMVSEKLRENAGGKALATMETIEQMPSILLPNYMYQNNGDLTFEKKMEEWGLDQPSLSNGAAYADLDNDGDLDLVVNNISQKAFVYRNNSRQVNQNNYIKINLKGEGLNTKGIGAKVVVQCVKDQFTQEVMPTRGFQSAVDHVLVFGLGTHQQIDRVRVIWPDSSVQSLHQVKSNQTLSLQQQDAKQVKLPQNNFVTYFSEANGNLGINFSEAKNSLPDFKRDRMMPNSISTAGPKIVRGDINNDGLEDIFMAGAKGSENRLYKQLRNGSFVATSKNSLEDSKTFNDKDAVFLDADGDGDQDLYIVSGGNEYQENAPELQDRLYTNNGSGNFKHNPGALPEMITSGSSVTKGDFNNDGLTDLFVGGRSIPGKYPLPPRSYLLKNTGKGKFEDVTAEFCPALMHPGMVTDARFVNINNDDFVDLIVVGEWMEVGIYLNDNAEKFSRKKDAIQQENSGWWLAIEASDFDQDGAMDLVLGNFGLNNPYHADAEHPARLLYKDFDNNGSIDPIFHYYIDDTLSFAYSRDELIGQIPSMKKKFVSYQEFAATNFSDYFTSDQLEGSDTLTAALFETVYLQNDGKGNFALKKLPVEAQFSPVYALASTDVNRDGHLDVITGGNFTQARVSTGQCDANYGIVLLGDGKGSFTTMDPAISGLKIKGDVRDISIIKIKGIDYMLVARNGEQMKVYKVRGAKALAF